ncbi:YqhA family protein [Candidatus Desantisbacteria bacterium]|nr:YqhA family protein [Candidatus Desantisbacteria bacterium]
MEKIFESILWNSRLVIMLAVVASMVSAIILFLIATWDVWIMTTHVWQYMTGQSVELYNVFHDNLVGHIVGAIDDFLLGTVLLIFSMGLYELFISKIFIEPLNILCLGGGILCVALALYFGHKAGGHS